MNARNQNYLWKRFSRFLPDRATITPQTSCMYWGFACGDGWYRLIKNLLLELEQLAFKDPVNFEGFQVTQVKEKLGGLRFYVNFYPTEEVDVLISAAEKASYAICEDCGRKGKLRQDRPWIRTLCTRCAKLCNKSTRG